MSDDSTEYPNNTYMTPGGDHTPNYRRIEGIPSERTVRRYSAYYATLVRSPDEALRYSQKGTYLPVETIRPILPVRSTEEVESSIARGLLNIIYPTTDISTTSARNQQPSARNHPSSARNQPGRSPEIESTVRLNMAAIYLKFTIQALLYLLILSLVFKLLVLCFKIPTILLIPLVAIAAWHMAARQMHQAHNRLHERDIHSNYSLAPNTDWIAKVHEYIEKTANFSLHFFGSVRTKLANSHLFDRQITFIPDNSSFSRR